MHLGLIEVRCGVCGEGTTLQLVAAEADIGKPRGLHHAVRHVDAETVDPAREPEAEDLLECPPHRRVLPVQIGLLRIEQPVMSKNERG